MRGLGAVLAVLIAFPALAAADEPRFGVTAVLSGQSVMGAGADTGIRPSATLEAEGPVAFRASTPLRAFVRLRLMGLPGETFDFTNVDTVRAVEVSLGSSKRIGSSQIGDQLLWTSVVGEWGFATAMPASEQFLETHHKRHFGGGLMLEERTSGAWVTLLFGRDEAVGDRGWGQWIISGAIPISVKDKGVFVIGGNASLGVGNACAQGFNCRQQDFVSVEFGVSLPDLLAVMR